MKKLLGIVVLSLLLSGSADATKYKKKQNIFKTPEYINNPYMGYMFATKKSKSKVMFPGTIYHFITGGNSGYDVANQAKKECNDFIKKSSKKLYCHTAVGWSKGYINGGKHDEFIKNFKQSSKEKVNQLSSKQILFSFKETCKQFGYKEGTEKLADCIKDLYLKQSDTQSQTTSTTSKAKRKIDPSVWDDIISLSSGLMNGSSKTTSKSQTHCIKTGEQTAGHNKICKYNCAGSISAITIGAAQICPMTIKK